MIKKFNEMTKEEMRRFIAGLGGKIRDEVDESGAAVIILAFAMKKEDETITVTDLVHICNLPTEDAQKLIRIAARTI